jgi:serine/threonine-protein kinase HipA
MSNRTAQVWYADKLVGELREDDNHELYFTYASEWLNGSPFPVSISLPLTNQEAFAHPFFSGLLPEAGVRERLCQQKGIDNRDDAGLLFAIGEDCAGALSIVPNQLSSENRPPTPLTSEDVSKLASSHGTIILDSQRERRFSLAGAQDKLSVIYMNDEYALPNRSHPSTHILKFETIDRVCFAEYIANKIAEQIGISVVATEFHYAEDGRTPFLRIERYDRWRNELNGNVNRFHQEDMLQAIGEPTALKYESDGGPSLSRIAAVIRENVAEPAESILQLRDWQMFNYLVGNWDGHAKNLALLYGENGSAPKLAPFYDLVAIEFFNVIKPGQWARKLAFKIGQHDTPEEITREDWRHFANDLEIPETPTINRLKDLAERIPDSARESRITFAEGYGDKAVYDKFERYILKRCRWVLKQLNSKSKKGR